MLLKDLIKPIKKIEYQNKSSFNPKINGIAYNSTKVEENYLFVAIEGFKNDGHSFIKSAIKNGAVAIVVEKELEKNYKVPLIRTTDSRLALAKLSKKFYQNSDEKISIIGITGTNGKTTTAFLIESVLAQLGFKTGLISTEKNKIGAKKLSAKLTTPESLKLHEIFQKMAIQQMDFAVMEVSSHSLKLNRVAGIDFNRQVFTNFAAEHLGFHDDLADYFAAKAKLFARNKGPAIINLDDEYANKIKQEAAGEVISYGFDERADFRAEELRSSLDGISYKLETASGDYEVDLNLLGEFNLYNSLAAIATLASFDLELTEIVKAIKEVKAVPGRCQVIKNEPLIMIDGAHNQQGLASLKKTLASFKLNNIFVVVSIYQDKDIDAMLKEITFFAQEIIISENSKKRAASAEMLAEMISGFSNYVVIKNLAKAIDYACQQAKKDDLILITGSLQTVRDANKLINKSKP